MKENRKMENRDMEHKEDKLKEQELNATQEETSNTTFSNEEEKKEPSLEEKYELLKNEMSSLNDKYLRTAAEFDNFRRRSITEKSNWIKYANERIILELCDVLDNFERALEQQDKHEPKAFRKGVEMIYKQLNELLKKENVVKINALHQEFDPQYHEALARIPSEKEENLIVAVIQNGYTMNEKVIRPVRVAVSNGEMIEKNDKKKEKNS
jgi:molecular chaperone GrpE